MTEYYEKVDRDVIICMVGDHAPAFISSLSPKEDNLIADNSINSRTVPYVIWSNFEVKYSSYLDYTSMVDLMPMVLNVADIPLSIFCQNILDLHESFPIRTSDGICVDKEFMLSMYDVNDNNYELLNQYYYMEYNSLLTTEEYQEDLFLP